MQDQRECAQTQKMLRKKKARNFVSFKGYSSVEQAEWCARVPATENL